jgi:formylmethanofuran dehydrogenase subunit E
MSIIENKENSRNDIVNDAALWEKAVAFHGHICGGLTIGYKAALYVRRLLRVEFSPDEEIVCVTENDACGVDAIQAMLGCSVGKGNLLFRLRGKQAFSFFNRATGASVRLILKENLFDQSGCVSKDDRQKYLFATDPEKLFDQKKVPFTLPEPARIFRSVPCENCGEKTAENHIHLADGKKLCEDCFIPYSRIL